MKTYIEINKTHLIHNLEAFARLTGKKIMFVVKANAYGHGLEEVVTITRNLPFIDYYAVDSVEEALRVKSTLDGTNTHKKILVIGWEDTEQIKDALENNIELAVPSSDYLKQVKGMARALKRQARVHLKIETGTGRLGMRSADVLNALSRETKNPQFLDVTGLYSHFANIEDTTDHSFAQHQLDTFTDTLKKIDAIQPVGSFIKHFSCSASTLLFPKTYFDIVRVGIAGYGFWPSRQTRVSYLEQGKPAFELKPVLSWVAKVAQVKSIGKGEPIGYGLTYKTFSKSRIIVIPVGYYDGYDRKLSNSACVIVHGVKAPVRGRICMNMFMADVTHIKHQSVKPGDRVILVGEADKEKVTIDELADLSGTINYETVSRINPLIKRLIV
ncbi:MAG: alanine racemase [Candidatus Omnitrophota bacterium]